MLNGKQRSVFMLFIAAMLAGCTNCFATSTPLIVNVKDCGAFGNGLTDDTAAINTAIGKAEAAGNGSTVFLPRGVYVTGSPALGKPQISIQNCDGLTFEGEAGTKIAVASDASAFQLSNCTDLTLKDFVVDRNPLEFSQGTIIAEDSLARTCDVEIEKGYENLDLPQFAATPSLKPFIYQNIDTYQQDKAVPSVDSFYQLRPRFWRFNFKLDGAMEDWVNKPCLITNASTGFCITGQNLTDLTIDSVSYWGGGGGAAWNLHGLFGTIEFESVKVAVPPGSDRLYCCAGGGQITGLRGKLVIENSEFTRIDGDGLDILANWNRVVGQPDPRTLETQPIDVKIGDEVQLWDWTNKVARGEAKVIGLQVAANDDLLLTFDSDLPAAHVGVGSEQANGITADQDGIDRVIDLSTTGQQTTIRNCIYQDFSANCLNIKAQNCAVENCQFYDSWQPAIAASPDWINEEGPTVTNLTIKNCSFKNCVHSNIEVGSVSEEQIPPVHPTPQPDGNDAIFGHETTNILIDSNSFSNYGIYESADPYIPVGDAVRVMNTANISVTRNDFGQSAKSGPSSPKLVIIGCTGVTISSNSHLNSNEAAIY